MSAKKVEKMNKTNRILVLISILILLSSSFAGIAIPHFRESVLQDKIDDSKVVITTSKALSEETDDPSTSLLSSTSEVLVSKKIWNDDSSSWVDSISTQVGNVLEFKITIHYIPRESNSWYLRTIFVNDTLPPCLSFNTNSARVVFNDTVFYGVSSYNSYTRMIQWIMGEQQPKFNKSLWNTSQPGHSHDTDTLSIYYDATVIDETTVVGQDNVVIVDAYETCPHQWHHASASATVIAEGVQPGITVEKYVLGPYGHWVKGITIGPEEIESETETVTFKLIVTNTGDVTLNTVVVKDILPSEFIYDSYIEPSPPTVVGNTLYWNFSLIPAGESVVIRFKALVSSGLCGNYTNHVYATGYACSEIVNDYDNAWVNIVCYQPDPSIYLKKYVKVGYQSQWHDDGVTVDPSVCDYVEFKLIVENTGNTSFDDIVVKDILPMGFIFDICYEPFAPTIVGNALYWDFNSKPIGWSDVIRFRAQIPTNICGLFTNVGNATGQKDSVTVYDDDTAWVNVICQQPVHDIKITKYVKENCYGNWHNDGVSINPSVCNWVEFKLIVENTGDSILDTVIVRDDFPAQLVYDGCIEPFAPTIVGNTFYWTFYNVPVGWTEVIRFRASVPSNVCGLFTNIGNVTGQSCHGSVYAQDSAWVNVLCNKELNIVKKVSNDMSHWYDSIDSTIGDTLYFKINVSNTGTMDLLGVSVIDELPLFLNYDGNAIPSLAVPYHNHTLEWFFPDLYAGDYVILTYSVTVHGAGCGYNVVNAIACGGSPSVEDRTYISVTDGMNVVKKISTDGVHWYKNATVSIGQTVRFNITVSYYDPDHTLFHIYVRDTLPLGLMYSDSASPKEPVIKGRVLFWNFTGPDDYLVNGSSLSIEFDAIATRTGELRNCVNVIGTECSGTTLYDDDFAVAWVNYTSLMKCEKQVRVGSGSWVNEVEVNVNSVISFNISILNKGYDPLYGIDIIDDLPDGLTYQTQTAKLYYKGTTYTANPIIDSENNTLVWDNINYYTGDYLNTNERLWLVFSVKVTDDGNMTNQANVTALPCYSSLPFCCSDIAFVNVTEVVNDLVADAHGPYSGDIGESINLVGSATGGVSPYTYAWDLDNDGGYDDATGTSPSRSWSQAGTYTIKLRVTDDHGNVDTDQAQVTITDEDAVSDLTCYGSLQWTEISPGGTVTGSFTLQNIGDSGSELDWSITDYPDWGSWSFSPSSGVNLEPSDGQITVYVTVTAPDERNSDFAGSIIVRNAENSNDYDSISVSLATPKFKPFASWIDFLCDIFPALEHFFSFFNSF
jgi:uncharacterized repeat protein (TIGR01451 family)/fimbrial isopeptide formation D2 family protein